MAEWIGSSSSGGGAERDDGSCLTLEPKQNMEKMLEAKHKMLEAKHKMLEANHKMSEANQKMLEAKHKIFLSHSGADKLFVEYLCDELERCLRFPFFDLLEDSLPIGEHFPSHIFAAMKQCYVGVVIMSEKFLTSKWPMMELVEMVEEAKRRSDYKLIPVMLRISFAELDNPKKKEQMQECWNEMEVRNPGRIKAEACAAALKYIRGLNGVVNTGLREKEFLKKVVDCICGIVPVELKMDDSYIQGKARICKAILDKIELQLKKDGDGVKKLGIYGVGGIGKTTICKALCNEMFTRFQGRVCHAELERVREEVLLRGVLERLSNRRKDALDGCNLDQLRNGLREGTFITESIFLALDNMSRTLESIAEAKRYVFAMLPIGSIVVVTTRYKESLVALGLKLDEHEYMAMPELEHEEAKALFLKSCEGRNASNEQLIQQCIKKCYYAKGDREGKSHYVPLALDVLGRRLAQEKNSKEWEAKLAMVGNDEFDEGDDHSRFSILRSSFDALSPDDQMLFMDVALFLPKFKMGEDYCSNPMLGIGIMEWLRMVHGMQRVEDVERGLERLRKMSLLEYFEELSSPHSISSGGSGEMDYFCCEFKHAHLTAQFRLYQLWLASYMLSTTSVESVGRKDGINVRIHDLWRSFCVAECKRGNLNKLRWSYERESSRDVSLCLTSPSGNRWKNVRRMAFVEYSSMDLGEVDFSHFSNVTVLKIINAKFKEHIPIDLSVLIHLRSLEIEGSSLTIQSIPRRLVLLQLVDYYEHNLVKSIGEDIEVHEKLEYLHLGCYSGKLPNLRKMVSLQKALIFESSDLNCYKEMNLSGRELEAFNSSVLKELTIGGCSLLNDMTCNTPFLALKVIRLQQCYSLRELPDLTMFPALEELYVDGCLSLSVLKCKAPLSALKTLGVQHCNILEGVLDLAMFPALEMLYLESCDQLKALKGSKPLSVMKCLKIKSCKSLNEVLDLTMFPTLKNMYLYECMGAKVLKCKGPSFTLKTITVYECIIFNGAVDLAMFPSLQLLELLRCYNLKALMNNAPHSALKVIKMTSCNSLVALPDLSMFMGLEELDLRECTKLETLKCDAPYSALKIIRMTYCTTLNVVPNLSMFPILEELYLFECRELKALKCDGTSIALKSLKLTLCTSLSAFPNLTMFPALEELDLSMCEKLKALKCNGPSIALKSLVLMLCTSLSVFPNLTMFPALEELVLSGCEVLKALKCNAPSIALKSMNIYFCKSLSSLPDLTMFPALEELDLSGCVELKALKCNAPSIALKTIRLWYCTSLSAFPDLTMFPALESLSFENVRS